MSEEQEFADAGIDELRKGLDQKKSFLATEKEFVKAEHDLLAKIHSITYVLMHIDEQTPVGSPSDTLSEELIELLTPLQEDLESGRVEELRIVQEEEATIEKLEEDIEHKKWRAVKKDKRRLEHEEAQALRVEKRELAVLHKTFKKATRIARRCQDDSSPAAHYLQQFAKIS